MLTPIKKSPYEPTKARTPLEKYALSPVLFAIPLQTNPGRPDMPGQHFVRHLHDDLTNG